MKKTAWHNTTGIQARRVFSYSEDPEMRKPETREAWLKARMVGVGGSDISAIAGFNPFKSAIDVFLEKTGRLRTEENQKMRWGRILEEPVAREYADSEEVSVQRVNAMLQHPEHNVAVVNLDRLIVKNGHPLNAEKSSVHRLLLQVGNGPLEVKTTGWAKAWSSGDIPDYYYTQLQWQLGITGLRWGQFAVLISGQELLKPQVCELNSKVFENLLLLANRFWTNHVKKDRAPEPDQNPATLNSMKLLYPDVSERTVSLDENLNEAINQRKELDVAIKKANAQKAAIDSKILRQMEDAKYGLTSEYKVTRVLRSYSRLDTKKFKEDHPKLAEQYTKSSESVYPTYKPIKHNSKGKELF